MVRFTSALLLAGALGFVNAQTIINENGEVIPATEGTVSPPGEAVIDETSGLEYILLTDAALENLTELELSNITLFEFPKDDVAKRAFTSCKTFPGDFFWPSKVIWKVFNLLTGGALIETVPIGAVCYNSTKHYDEAKCQNLLDNWTKSETHANDPSSVMSPLYQGQTCLPQNSETGTCELGGYASYVVKATTIAQIQLAINFARNLNLRLVVRNTGHDFLGRSTGAGALSIWTHHFKNIKFIETYKSKSYSGPAFKLGAGVQVGELYAAAKQYGVTAVGGECKGVGVTGGYIAGGGHSPLSSKYGMGADQVLSIDVVLPNGRFVIADEDNNRDLFWALRGGGGSTFGVVTGMTLKVYPKMSFSGLTWTILTGPDTSNTDEIFWAAMEAYWSEFPSYAEQGTYGYSTLFSRGPGIGYTWTMHPWTVPGMSLTDFKAMVAPLFAEWAALGFEFQAEYFEHDNFYDTWSTHFPTETVGNTNLHTASRLFPKKNWQDENILNSTLAAIRSVVEEGSALIGYNVNGAAPAGTPDSAVNPAWREAVMFGIVGGGWAPDTPPEDVEATNRQITYDWMERLRQVTPGGGGYGNEGDVMEPDFAQAFYGSSYDRLLQIKKATDPWDVFWAPTAVGSEGWYVTDQEEWLTTQTGRLCRKGF
ncbi:hypothetical protein AJ80_03044 [Polytolypa hystricis UAMH7299]|uniref:FAD-binding PCMH-type domain-containing protein n=1 Tax=Polytolypa hystricis (strain UAMH7299) TaxID=1447883 RepID=A0A2B7YKM4_POLH7|nr:hypothetical protein AJ80_03044 [Polytolypa hystricis UAMH7299]